MSTQKPEEPIVWKKWEPGADNTDANDEIPIAEDIDGDHPTPTMQRIIETPDDGFSAPMSYEDFLAWTKTL